MIKILVFWITSVGFLIATCFVCRGICFGRDLAGLRAAAPLVISRFFIGDSGKAGGDGPDGAPVSIPTEKSAATSRVGLGGGEIGPLGTAVSAVPPDAAADIVPLRGSSGPTCPAISAACDRRGALS